MGTYILTSLNKGENIKMSTTEREYMDSSEEEEQMVARVGGRGLVQALLRVRRERAGRVPQNWQRTQDVRMRPQRPEGGRSTWLGSGKETKRASGMGETKWDY